jgi:hypothetical protein
VSAPAATPAAPAASKNEIEDWLSVKAQTHRHTSLGLAKPVAAGFIEKCEFVSLGSYCAVARALQCVGLKQLTYPFDWARCPLEGVIKCVENKFKDFLTYSVAFEQEGEQVYGRSTWGGSFWHHDPTDPQTQMDMARRIERFYGHGEVPADRARLFVRAANSSAEVEDSLRLYRTLCKALPRAKIYVLLLVDLQSASGPLSIAGCEGFLCWRVHRSVCPAGGKWTMQRQAEAYAEALAFSIRLWGGEQGLASRVRVLPNLSVLSQTCDDFDGTDPATELWLPKFVGASVSQGNNMSSVRSPQLPEPESIKDKSVAVRESSASLSDDSTLAPDTEISFAASQSSRCQSDSPPQTPKPETSKDSSVMVSSSAKSGVPLPIKSHVPTAGMHFSCQNHSPQTACPVSPTGYPTPMPRGAQVQAGLASYPQLLGNTGGMTGVLPTKSLPGPFLATSSHLQPYNHPQVSRLGLSVY